MADQETTRGTTLTAREQWLPAVKVAAIYAVFAAIWIVFSDRAIDLFAVNKAVLSTMQTWKGLFFVTITAVLVFLLVQFYFQQQIALTHKFKASQQRLDLMLSSIPGGIQENDLEGRITYCNAGHHKILEYPEGSLIGYHIWDFQTNENDKRQLQEYFLYLVKHQPEPESYTSRNLTRKGNERILEVSWDYQRDVNGELTGFISVITDITQSQQREQEILHLAYYDPLTSLANRFRSLEQLSTMITAASQSGEQVGVLVLDLDHFKKINDSLGHDTGDRLLQQLVKRLHQCLTKAEFLGRLGGDEFIILHRHMPNQDRLALLIDAVLSQFMAPFNIENREMVLTTSMGIAVYPNDGSSASELLRNADSALFHAKDSGRNTYSYFTRAMNLDVTRRFTIEEQLHSALDKNEFNLVYQPQVELQGNRTIAAEALLRWHNPVLGQVPPDEFISVAEQSNLIVPIGRFVLSQSLAMLAQVQKLEPDFRMAINLSPVQFRDNNLIDTLNELLEVHQVSPQSIELEITEGVLLSGSSRVRHTLQALSEMGIKLAMDDFGTGYSSLSYLRRYPFDVLKIDRSFVGDIASKPAEREMINAIVAMSQGLGLKVVAEGVETEEQRHFLQTVGCDYAQGYFFNRPLSEAQLIEKLQQQG
jgi:diguanylate cyclase (GGDEF)-like protein/PAS domain S-box-containing protein